jgi:YfiH family protein
MAEAEFIAADWPAPGNITAGTTMRIGGVSHGNYADFNLGAYVADEAAAVAANRQRLGNLLDLPGHPAWLRQVHGVNVVAAPFSDAEPDEVPEADASIAVTPGTVCAVLTADCLPVLFVTRDGSAVAAAHAGWRGLCAGVLEATVNAFTCDPEDLYAWLGPAISQEAFEVGNEVREQFLQHDPMAADAFESNSAGRWQADLYQLARQRLRKAGVTDVFGGNRCTYKEKDTFFSYRRDGQCGRMASLIYRRVQPG